MTLKLWETYGICSTSAKWHRSPVTYAWMKSGGMGKEAGSATGQSVQAPLLWLQALRPQGSYLSSQPKFIVRKIRTKTRTHQIGLLCRLNSCYSKGESWTSRATITWKVVRNVEILCPILDLRNQNLHFNKIPRWLCVHVKGWKALG